MSKLLSNQSWILDVLFWTPVGKIKKQNEKNKRNRKVKKNRAWLITNYDCAPCSTHPNMQKLEGFHEKPWLSHQLMSNYVIITTPDKRLNFRQPASQIDCRLNSFFPNSIDSRIKIPTIINAESVKIYWAEDKVKKKWRKRRRRNLTIRIIRRKSRRRGQLLNTLNQSKCFNLLHIL